MFVSVAGILTLAFALYLTFGFQKKLSVVKVFLERNHVSEFNFSQRRQEFRVHIISNSVSIFFIFVGLAAHLFLSVFKFKDMETGLFPKIGLALEILIDILSTATACIFAWGNRKFRNQVRDFYNFRIAPKIMTGASWKPVK